MRMHGVFGALAALLLTATPVVAQSGPATNGTPGASDTAAAAEEEISTAPPITIQYTRPMDQRGLNMFETPKENDVPFEGFKLNWGAAFTQQFQMIDHSNTAAPRLVDGVDQNQLADIGAGFNLATANLALDAQVAPGIRVSLESYMSSRHHNEFWVKGGYLQIDESPIDLPILHTLMDYLTIKAGMFELNYGDAHFRRTDNGNAMMNPFVENYIMDSFTTEIGTEVYFRTGPFLAMVGVTDGVNKGGVTAPAARGPAFLGKVGFDSQMNDDLRVRLTGSMYTVDKTPGATLFGGDRAGSRYYNVMDNSSGAQFTNGRINPGFRNEMTAFQINPFVKFGGLELFGVIEQAEGKAAAETETREWNQYAGDVLYRFLPREQLYVGGRYNTASGRLQGMTEDVSVDRMALAAGWFITPNILVKGEYVNQEYNDFPALDIRNGGKFNGMIIEGVVAF